MNNLESEEDKRSWEEALVRYIGQYCRKDLTIGKFYFRETVSSDWRLNIDSGIVDMVIH